MESQSSVLTRRRLFRWRINDGRPVATVINTFATDARILKAQPNYLYRLQEEKPAAAKPETPGPQSDSTQYMVAKLRLPQAHALSKGNNVIVAVIDTAVDAAHPELAGVIAGTFDATGAPEKPQPHGTAMAGAIAAHGQLVGTAPGVKLLSVQAFGAVRSEGTGFNILKGLEWAAKENANIVNMSFAGPSDPALQEALAAAREKGMVLIAAAGNAGPRSRPLYPAADPNVIAVTATDPDDRLFARANRGTHIAVAAPGVDVLVASPNGGYELTSGTSVAAAEVTGVAALMLERNGTLDPGEVRRLLTSTARNLGPADQFGAGLVDAYGALSAAGAKPTASAPRQGGTP
jgi:subtilisin family serine protease